MRLRFPESRTEVIGVVLRKDYNDVEIRGGGMDEHFEYIVRVSGGWSETHLILSDHTAQLEFRSASMGQIPARCVMNFHHRKLTPFHGALRLTRLETYGHRQNEFGAYVLTDEKETVLIESPIETESDDEQGELFNRLDIEYIRLPEPQATWLDPDDLWGVHEMPETFSLVLLILRAGERYQYAASAPIEETPLSMAIYHLDKLHLTLASPATGTE
jgi:hypothetical protein